MNVYLYELKSNFKFTLIWTITALILSIMVIYFYPMIKDEAQTFIDIMSNYPKAIQNAFGLSDAFTSSPLGYYSTFPYTFLIICLTLESMLLGINIVNKEAKFKTSDFLFAKPISRLNILVSKMLAALTLTIVSTILISLLTYIVLISFGNINLVTYLLIFIAVLILQLFFLTLGSLIATMLVKVKSNITLAMAVVLGFYAFSSFADEKMRILIPFQYFKTDYIMDNNHYEGIYLFIMIMLIIIFSVSSKIFYIKKDIK